MEDYEKNKVLFTQLILMLHGAAMQQMGKIKNPVTDKIERDLTQAQFSIDMLDMMKEKTKGNLSPEEERFLHSLLQELKLNYVDEAGKDQRQQTQEQSSTESAQ
ncbi:MAG: DUF1844 domain-containing protein [Bacteroidota bacterium]